MQDMATMQQHSITSPAPATTTSNTQDSPVESVSNASAAAAASLQEASRTRARDEEPRRRLRSHHQHQQEEEEKEKNKTRAEEKEEEKGEEGEEREREAQDDDEEEEEEEQEAASTEAGSPSFPAAATAAAAGETAGSAATAASPPPSQDATTARDSTAPAVNEDRDASESAVASEEKYPCPICDTVLSSQHLFTQHIRVHNSEDAEAAEDGHARTPPPPLAAAKGFVCRVCAKVLSSASSLDRHVLVHSGERPFKCRVCGVAFTTNGNMHRHMRTHAAGGGGGSGDSDGSSDCGASPGPRSPSSPHCNLPKKRRVSPPESSCGSGADEDSPPRLRSPALSDPGCKRKAHDFDDSERRRVRSSPGALSDADLPQPQQRLRCPRCGRDDAQSLQELEAHLEEAHSEAAGGGGGATSSGGVVRCQVCDATFKNPRALNIHRFTVHREAAHASPQQSAGAASPQSRAVIGFKDLTFVDFSSEKFPHIARIVCERSLHRPTSVYHRFQCEACGRAFPCGSALDIHRAACVGGHRGDAPTDLTKRGAAAPAGEESEEEIEERKRDDFFAGLDLRNKSSASSSPDFNNQYLRHREERFESALYFNAVPPPPLPQRTDLADIQSIITVAASSGGMLQDLSGSGGCSGSAAGEEEQQDDFAAEFRRMKLKGEFPCRLCTAVFPNLRALKGHNRAHLSGATGPFRCNMCPFAHSDKAVLVRHLRTHNGDRPYECALCNYAFTTKANCERHLRNRHSKLTRDEVKKSIIYHPSEDPTNDPGFVAEAAAAAATTGCATVLPSPPPPPPPMVKRALVFGEESPAATDPADPVVATVPARPWEPLHDATSRASLRSDEGDDLPPSAPPTDHGFNEDSHDEELLKRSSIETLVSLAKSNPRPFPKLSPIPSARSDDQRVVNHENHVMDYEREATSPLDLSMDALDLSKKREASTAINFSCNKTVTNESKDEETYPQDLSRKKGLEFNKMGSPALTMCPPFPELRKGAESPTPFGAATNGPPKMEVSAAAAAAANLYASRHLGPLFGGNGLTAATAFGPAAAAAAAAAAMGPFQGLPLFLPTVPQSLYPTAAAAAAAAAASNHQEIADMKERLQKELIRGLQLTSGGTLLDVHGAAGQLRAFHNQVLADTARNKESLKMEITDSSLDIKPLPKPLPPSPVHNNNLNNNNNVDNLCIPNMNNNNNNNSSSVKPGRERDAAGAVKMVIKNGVLMPKQKQRRYRTERPFACEHCSARFTLRSNMERHVKQQHPQFWSQRQRGAGPVANGPSRRPTVNVPVPPQPAPPQPLQPKAELLLDEKQPHSAFDAIEDGGPEYIDDATKKDGGGDEDNNNKTFISDEVRHLIAQQLKSKRSSAATPEPAEEEDGDAPSDPPRPERKDALEGGGADLASVSRLLDNASTQTQAFQQYFRGTQDGEEFGREEGSEEDEEGLVAGSNSEGNNSGSDENKSESEAAPAPGKKKSAYSLAPNRVSCPFCLRKFPWSSSLRRHVLTHTGQKPFKCPHCPLLFTTKSNCDRHLLRKHSNNNNNSSNNNNNNASAHSSSNSTSTATPSNSTSTTNVSNSSSGNSSSGSGGGGSSGTETSPVAAQVSTTTTTGNNSNNYTMRNVPERPYKCQYCPSSTFSTLSNLRKHVASKHTNSSSGSSPPTSPPQQTLPLPGPGSDASGPSGASSHYEESHCGSGSEDGDTDRRTSESAETPNTAPLLPPPVPLVATPVRDASSNPAGGNSSSSGGSTSSELPFKCHLCDGGYADRQDALDHIRDAHPAEFKLLMSKGALDTAAEDNAHTQHHGSNQNHEESSPTADENIEQLRGRFPDYANRKVMCAFCMRRFWSAEDLRRHMRTHTGERPFSCDICRRRFTLKHSMLRHRKKHAAGGSLAIPAVGASNSQTEDGSGAVSGDEDSPDAAQPLPPSSSIATAFSTVNHNNNTIIPGSAITKVAQHRLLEGTNGEEETDLIGSRRYCQNKQFTLPLTHVAICHANLFLFAKHTQSSV